MPDHASDRISSIRRVGRPSHHRMVGVTLKTALAAGIAWQLAVLLPSFLPNYAFYAPLGALTVMYSALYDSIVEGLRAVSAVTIGILVSLLMHVAAAPNAISVALALAVGTVLGNLRILGDQGSWVPIAALFVFTAGRADIREYVLGYLCQLSLGAIVGLLVNSLLFPPLALHEVERATRAVRREIVAVLDVVADLVVASGDTADEVAGRTRGLLAGLPDTRQRLRTAMAQARRAERANPRRRRWRVSRHHVLALAGTTERLAELVEDLAHEVLDERDALRDADFSRVAAATGALRDVIAQSRAGVPDAEMVDRTDDLLDDAVPDQAPFVVRHTAAGLRRCLQVVSGSPS